ncbi:MAG: hypothetical protein IPM29_07910 [Planctomycetes bacterium]|nr:hypothetical protein [Planctomycetota bacterium]
MTIHDQQSRPPEHDLHGVEMTPDERELLDLFRRLRRLAERRDLAPCVSANVKQAMVMVWNACNDLALVDAPPGHD